MELNNQTGTVFNIQKFCTDDGPGIRTTVFLKGCHLRCAWCHNPEGLSMAPTLAYTEMNCVSCGLCAAVCENGAHSFENGIHEIDREKCVRCGKCVENCPYHALSFCGERMTADAVMQSVLADKAFYSPKGGMTVSGGEPLLQPDFVYALLSLAKQNGIHTCIETSGAVDFAVFERIMDLVDLFLFDIKETDEQNHIKYTGVSSKLPQENIRKLDAAGKAVLMRCPIIPGVNDRESHFEALNTLYRSLDCAVGIQLMPYHMLGQGKTTRFGAKTQAFKVPSAEQKAEWNRNIKQK